MDVNEITAGFDRVIVEKIEFDPPNDLEHRTVMRGKIISVGPGITWYRVGDIVVYGKYCGTDIDENYAALRQEEIVARLED